MEDEEDSPFDVLTPKKKACILAVAKIDKNIRKQIIECRYGEFVYVCLKYIPELTVLCQI